MADWTFWEDMVGRQLGHLCFSLLVGAKHDIIEDPWEDEENDSGCHADLGASGIVWSFSRRVDPLRKSVSLPSIPQYQASTSCFEATYSGDDTTNLGEGEAPCNHGSAGKVRCGVVDHPA